MKSSLRIGAAAILAGCLSAPGFAQRDSDNGPADRCESTTCFNQLRVRDIEVVTNTSMIVLVGPQECPFLVEMTGLFCDLTYLPPGDIVFRPARLASARTPAIVGGFGTAADGGGPIEQTRVCANSLNMGLPANAFNSVISDDPGDTGGLSCRIKNVQSLTDDERLQLYVDNQIAAPPPPFGTGSVQAPENPEEPAAQSDDPAAPEEMSRREQRRAEREARRNAAAND